MNYKVFLGIFSLSMILFVSCGNDDNDNDGVASVTPNVETPTEDTSISAAKKLQAFKDSLCADVKFVVRKTSSGKFEFSPVYDIVESQTDYKFYSDGTGLKKYIELTGTDQGFVSNEESFKWQVIDGDTYQLKIMPANEPSYTLSNVSIGEFQLSSSEMTLQKEANFSTKTSLKEFISYSISDFYTKEYTTSSTPKGYYVTPCVLTLFYKNGRVARIIYSNKNARGSTVGWERDGTNYKFYDQKLCLSIGYTGDDELMFPGFRDTDDKISSSNFIIPVGYYNAEKDTFTPIENNIKYDFPSE